MGSDDSDILPIWQLNLHLGNRCLYLANDSEWLEPDAPCTSSGANIMGLRADHCRSEHDFNEYGRMEHQHCISYWRRWCGWIYRKHRVAFSACQTVCVGLDYSSASNGNDHIHLEHRCGHAPEVRYYGI